MDGEVARPAEPKLYRAADYCVHISGRLAPEARIKLSDSFPGLNGNVVVDPPGNHALLSGKLSHRLQPREKDPAPACEKAAPGGARPKLGDGFSGRWGIG